MEGMGTGPDSSSGDDIRDLHPSVIFFLVVKRGVCFADPARHGVVSSTPVLLSPSVLDRCNIFLPGAWTLTLWRQDATR